MRFQDKVIGERRLPAWNCSRPLLIVVVSLSLLLAPTPCAAVGQDGTNGIARWSYDTTSPYGPPFWPTLTRESDGGTAFAGCSTATQPRQSPVAVVSAVIDTTLQPIDTTEYAFGTSTGVEVTADGRILRLAPQGALSVLGFNNQKWVLEIVEVHSPGEHVLGGSVGSAELHFIHRPDLDLATVPKQWLIVATKWEVSEYGQHTELEKLVAAASIPPFPSSANTTSAGDALPPVTPLNASVTANLTIDWSAFYPRSQGYVTYSGTWTYPPCEAAQWVLMESPQKMSVTQLRALRDAFVSSFLAPSGNRRVGLTTYVDRTSARRYVEGSAGRCAGNAISADERIGTDTQQSNLAVAIVSIVFAVLAVLATAALFAARPPTEAIDTAKESPRSKRAAETPRASEQDRQRPDRATASDQPPTRR